LKILHGILALIVAAGLTSVRACDLCGCYTPQLNATPQMNFTLLPWERGWYGAVGEQFTRFGTLQLDGEEVANPIGQFLNSSITQLDSKRSFTKSKFLALRKVVFMATI
jgi:hypothetical protein